MTTSTTTTTTTTARQGAAAGEGAARRPGTGPGRSRDGGLRWCPACGDEASSYGPGPRGRPDAACPRCRALERHRFLSLVLDGLAPRLALASLVVDVAPSRPVAQQLRRLCPQGYLGVDFDPGADGRAVDVRASLTDLPLADGSADLLVAYHVLEHVPDDAAAMREVARVLKPGGLALLQVPWAPGRATDEDPDAPADERVRRFGQADHVRMYGHDVEDRLRAAGLDVARMTPVDWLGDEGAALMHLWPEESSWVVTPTTSADGVGRHRGVLAGGTSPGGLAGALVRARATTAEAAARRAEAEEQGDVVRRDLAAARARVARLEDEVRAARKESARWQRAYERLRGRLPVRVAAGAVRGARGLGRAVGALRGASR